MMEYEWVIKAMETENFTPIHAALINYRNRLLSEPALPFAVCLVWSRHRWRDRVSLEIFEGPELMAGVDFMHALAPVNGLVITDLKSAVDTGLAFMLGIGFEPVNVEPQPKGTVKHEQKSTDHPARRRTRRAKHRAQ